VPSKLNTINLDLSRETMPKSKSSHLVALGAATGLHPGIREFPVAAGIILKFQGQRFFHLFLYKSSIITDRTISMQIRDKAETEIAFF
jgi:hypothetical protein